MTAASKAGDQPCLPTSGGETVSDEVAETTRRAVQPAEPVPVPPQTLLESL